MTAYVVIARDKLEDDYASVVGVALNLPMAQILEEDFNNQDKYHNFNTEIRPYKIGQLYV